MLAAVSLNKLNNFSSEKPLFVRICQEGDFWATCGCMRNHKHFRRISRSEVGAGEGNRIRISSSSLCVNLQLCAAYSNSHFQVNCTQLHQSAFLVSLIVTTTGYINRNGIIDQRFGVIVRRGDLFDSYGNAS